MRNRKRLSLLGVGVLFVGLSLGAGVAGADTSTKTPGEKTKGKTGDACKTNSDCDQSAQPQTCSGGKCQVHRVPPPTT
jgi:hypothetical protein